MQAGSPHTSHLIGQWSRSAASVPQIIGAISLLPCGTKRRTTFLYPVLKLDQLILRSLLIL